MPYENILYELDSGVARVTLNRPEKLNALSWPMQAMELMGARTMQRMAAERDAIGRQSPVVTEFYRIAKEQGLKAALQWRDSGFED
jgi:enoyl-CoA hydratase